MTLTYHTLKGWRAIWQGFISYNYFRTEKSARKWIDECSKKGRPQ